MTDQERIAVAEEATSLPIHVQMCALRHRALIVEIRNLRALVVVLIPASLVSAGGSLAPYLPQLLGILRAVAGE